jgi:hypothetical protein
MVKALNWSKDRNRRLAKRARAEEIEEARRLRFARTSQSSRGTAHELRASTRHLADKIARYDRVAPGKGDSGDCRNISCEGCNEMFPSKPAGSSTAVEAPIH